MYNQQEPISLCEIGPKKPGRSQRSPKKIELTAALKKQRVEQLNEDRHDLSKRFAEIEAILKERGVFEKYVTKGTPPSNRVELPIAADGRAGLDLEGMLAGMAAVTKSEEGYSLYGNNCSAAVAEVIKGGIRDEDAELRRRFKSEGYLGISTPQVVHTNASKLFAERDPKVGIFGNFIKFLESMKEYFAGKNEPKKKEGTDAEVRSSRVKI